MLKNSTVDGIFMPSAWEPITCYLHGILHILYICRLCMNCCYEGPVDGYDREEEAEMNGMHQLSAMDTTKLMGMDEERRAIMAASPSEVGQIV